MNNIKYLYLNYEKYSKMFEYDENNSDNMDSNVNRLHLKEDKNDSNLKSNLEFTKIYYEKNRVLLNRFTQEFHEEINVIIYIFFYFFIFQNYKYDLTKLMEIFDRKNIEEQNQKECKDDRMKEAILIKLSNMKEELQHEISLFKNNKENELIEIIKKFFRCLHENNSEILNK